MPFCVLGHQFTSSRHKISARKIKNETLAWFLKRNESLLSKHEISYFNFNNTISWVEWGNATKRHTDDVAVAAAAAASNSIRGEARQ